MSESSATDDTEARRQLGAQRCAAALDKIHRVQDLLAEAHTDLGPVHGVGSHCERLSMLIGYLFSFEPSVARLVRERPMVNESILVASSLVRVSAETAATADPPGKQLELCPGYFRGDLVIVQVDRRNTRLCQLSDTSDFSTSVLVGAVFWPVADEWRPCYIRPQSILRIADGERAEKARASLARLKSRQASCRACAPPAANASGQTSDTGPLSPSESTWADSLSRFLLGLGFEALLDLNQGEQHPVLVVPARLEAARQPLRGKFVQLADLYDRAQAARGDSRRAVRR